MDKTLDEEFYLSKRIKRIQDNPDPLNATYLNKVLFSRAIKLFSDPTADAYRLWANLDSNLNDHPHAIIKLQKALAIDPNSWPIAQDLGESLYSLNKFPQALDFFIKAMGIAPHMILLHKNFIKTIESLGKLEDLEPQYEDFLELYPENRDNYYFYYAKAEALLELEKYSQSLSSYKKTLEFFPNNATLHFHYAKVLYYEGNLAESLKELQLVVQLDPMNRDALNNIPFLMYNLGSVKQAIIEYENMLNSWFETYCTYFGMILAKYHLEQNKKVAVPYRKKLEYYKRTNLEKLRSVYQKELELTMQRLTGSLDENQRDFFERKLKGVKFVLSLLG